MSLLLLASLGVIAWRGGLLNAIVGARRASAALGAGQSDSTSGSTGSGHHPKVALAPQTRDLAGDLESVRSFIQLGYPIFCGGGNGKYVALTFDDGPGPYTAQTLEILRDAKARATFFLVGRNLGYYPGLAQQEAPTNSVGDHTWTHAYLTKLSLAEQQQEIDDTRQAVAEATAGQVVLFRPPGGFHNASVDQLINSYGMLEIMWSTDSMDSHGATGREVLENVADGLRPGAIILMHENRGTTLQMLPRVLRIIAAMGYQTVTVPELLRLDPPSIDQLQKNAAKGDCVAHGPATS
jgi:peptidoglycan/xylan/chitin deacetylase (PgdA/CDA1 family)